MALWNKCCYFLGDFRFRLCSPVMVFTLLINGIQIYLTYLVYCSHLTKLLRSNETYDDAVKLVLMLVLLNINFYAVVFILLETGKISNYLNHWKQFNVSYQTLNKSYCLNLFPSYFQLPFSLKLFFFIFVQYYFSVYNYCITIIAVIIVLVIINKC